MDFVWASYGPVLLVEDPGWFRNLDQLLPIILVVLVGVLTLVKRGIEVLIKKRAARSASKREADKKPDEPTVFDEMRRYFELIEGRPKAEEEAAPEPQAAAPPTISAPARPPDVPPFTSVPPTVAPHEVFSLPHAADMVEEAAHRVETTPERLGAALSTDFKPLRSKVSVSYADLARGSGPAVFRRRKLTRIKLLRGRENLRSAFLWTEILGKPRHEGPLTLR